VSFELEFVDSPTSTVSFELKFVDYPTSTAEFAAAYTGATGAGVTFSGAVDTGSLCFAPSGIRCDTFSFTVSASPRSSVKALQVLRQSCNNVSCRLKPPANFKLASTCCSGKVRSRVRVSEFPETLTLLYQLYSASHYSVPFLAASKGSLASSVVVSHARWHE